MDSIADLLKAGYAREVVELTEHALEKVEQANLNMDDSDGDMAGILERLQGIHFEACEQAKPDPTALAERLFDWEMRTQFDTFYDAASTYAKVLGASGLAAYRRRAEAAWAQVPQRRPEDNDPEEFGRNSRIKSIMEALARVSGDVESLVEVKARDLSTAYSYLQIARTYREAGQSEKALEWAERGIKAFPDQTESRLREFLADEYHRRNRHDEAMQLIWKTFSERISLEGYSALKNHAEPIGQWPKWRAKALDFIRAQIENEKEQFGRKRREWFSSPEPPDHSLLVQIFIWEKDIEAAWREAQAGGCSGSCWMELARLREKDFPADIVPIYQKQVDKLVNHANNTSYAEAVKLLAKIRRLMTQLDQADQFLIYLGTIRTTHKPKRNFIKLTQCF